jgi:hypothetical protein
VSLLTSPPYDTPQGNKNHDLSRSPDLDTPRHEVVVGPQGLETLPDHMGGRGARRFIVASTRGETEVSQARTVKETEE